MISKLIAFAIHRVKLAYDEVSVSKDGAKEILKVSLTDLITEILDDRDKKEKDKSTPTVGFRSAGSKNDNRSSPTGTKN